MIRLASLPIAAAILATSLSVSAAPMSDNVVRVSYRDLDLTSASGQAVLTHRLHRAADMLCYAGKTRDLAILSACRSDVMASVQPAVQLAINDSKAGGVTADAAADVTLRTLR